MSRGSVNDLHNIIMNSCEIYQHPQIIDKIKTNLYLGQRVLLGFVLFYLNEWHSESFLVLFPCWDVRAVAKLSPSSKSSWAEMAIFPINPATHPPDKYQNKSQQVVGRQNQLDR